MSEVKEEIKGEVGDFGYEEFNADDFEPTKLKPEAEKKEEPVVEPSGPGEEGKLTPAIRWPRQQDREASQWIRVPPPMSTSIEV